MKKKTIKWVKKVRIKIL